MLKALDEEDSGSDDMVPPPPPSSSSTSSDEDVALCCMSAIAATTSAVESYRRRGGGGGRHNISEGGPEYKKGHNINFFMFNKFARRGPRFSHSVQTSCHKAPAWGGGSWIKTWKIVCDSGGEGVIKCSFSGCNNNGMLGAHVMYTGSNEQSASWYIVPACHKCNRKHGQGARLKENTKLLKVMSGRVFKRNKILIGTIDVDEYKRTKLCLKYDNNKAKDTKRTLKEAYLLSSSSNKFVRLWPCRRLGGWGWT